MGSAEQDGIQWDGLKRKGMLLMAAVFLWAITIVAFSFSRDFRLAATVILLVGFTSSFSMALNMSLLQLLSPPEMHGRVISVSLMTFGLMPLGVLPVSMMAEKVGTATALAGAGILFVFITGVFFVLNRTVRHLEV